MKPKAYFTAKWGLELVFKHDPDEPAHVVFQKDLLTDKLPEYYQELGRILEGNGSILRFTSSKKKPFWAKLKVSEDKMRLDFEFIHDLKFDAGMLKRKKGGRGRRKTGGRHEA